jgi:hypothetical protein
MNTQKCRNLYFTNFTEENENLVFFLYSMKYNSLFSYHRCLYFIFYNRSFVHTKKKN